MFVSRPREGKLVSATPYQTNEFKGRCTAYLTYFGGESLQVEVVLKRYTVTKAKGPRHSSSITLRCLFIFCSRLVGVIL